MKPQIEGKTVDTIEAIEYQRTGEKRELIRPFGESLWVDVFAYLPAPWPEEGYMEPDQVRIRFTDGSTITFRGVGYEVDGTGVDYQEAPEA